MFAVIKTGGKQYRVAAQDILKVEKLAGAEGDTVEFSEILAVGDGDTVMIGKPTVEGAAVTAEVVEQGRARRLVAFKKRRRKNSRRTIGHRQQLTTVRIDEILTDGAKPAKAAAKKPAAKPAEEKPAKSKAKPAPKKPEKDAGGKSAAMFAQPDGEVDDLKKISGVGKVLEGKLNALGIYQFAQVAGFSADDIAKVDDALSFKGRIERDDWVGQARALIDGK